MVKAIINDFAENCYIVYNDRHAYIIDPGSNTESVERFIESEALTVLGILLTHGHYDHISGVNRMVETYGVDVFVHAFDRDFLFDPNLNLSSQMDQIFRIESKHHVKTIVHGATFSLGTEVIQAYHTPGHSRGGLSFHYQNMVFSGDALFKETIGRTDLPTGNHDQLIETIIQMVDMFDDNTVVYPGHGPVTTIAHEKTHNPFILDKN